MTVYHPKKTDRILHNPGCGMLYLQRGFHKLPYSALPADSWFLRERLSDKIAIHLPWSALEPEEGHYLWEHPDWEGCFQSWMDAGFKVGLQIRGMDTLGTFYNEGTPQWVFDAGAKLSYFAFGSNNPRKFRLYGCADEPKNTTDESYWAVDGGWLADWTLLAESEVVRPSVNVPTVPVIDGEDNEFYVPTAEDFEAAVAGAEFPVALSGLPVRYVRILITETWNPDQLYRISFGEMHFFSYTPEE